ncbi:DUF6443 domain-containing protein [Labilibaculum euxinus]
MKSYKLKLDMKKYIIGLFVFFMMTLNIQAATTYQDYSLYLNWSEIVQTPLGGGGGVNINIANDVLTVRFSAGFSSSRLKGGNIAYINSTPRLPDLDLGIIGDHGYVALIRSGYLVIAGPPLAISTVSLNYTKVFSTTPPPTSNLLSLSDKNYIASYAPVKEAKNESALQNLALKELGASVQYFDGLGRPNQTVLVKASPNEKDLIQPICYDEFGRQKRDYLPYEAFSGTTGSFRTNGVDVNYTIDCEHYKFYNVNNNSVVNDLKPFSEKKFDGSPLNRVLEQGAPGSVWQPKAGVEDYSGNTVKIVYGANVASEVKCFVVENDVLKLRSDNYYSINQLYKTITKDENWTLSQGKLHTTEEFKDKLGQVVLKRSYVGSSSSPTKVDTYYVYDNFGLLRYVLPPEAVIAYGGASSTSGSGTQVIDGAVSLTSPDSGISKYIVGKGASVSLKPGFNFTATSSKSLTITSLEPATSEFDELIYAYKYDGRKRMIEKKLPGAEPVYMVYDKRDRLVATQDGNQREDNKWLVTKYDCLNRPVLTGIYQPAKNSNGTIKNQDNLQTEVNTFYTGTANPMYESRGTALKSYDNKSFPKTLADADVLTANYYGDYSVTHCPQTSYNTSQIANSYLLTKPKGQLTATWAKTLNASSGKAGGLWTVNFYDKKYRLVQSRSDNYLGGYDRITNVYDFVGKVDRSIHEHIANSKTIVETQWMTYDHAGRLTKVEQQYSGAVSKAKTTISEMIYDELGQLKTKKLTGAGRNLDYQYNIRGWLTSMNGHKKSAVAGKGSDEFGFALNYNAGATSFGGQNQYNGNIGSMEWWSNGISGLTNHQQAYGYTYDALNRITNADFRENLSGWKNTASTYDVNGITYDLNGNILSLNRDGAGTQIDQLAYGYNGNQLTYVNDGKDDAKGFKEFSNTTSEYAYDANGNMISDDNKKISLVAYNLLNLPESITRKDALNKVRNVAYAYSASGAKLENRLPDNKLLQYCANFVYENGSLKYILNSEGKLEVNGTGGTYKYFVKDHLGNTRLAVGEGESSVATELNHYYPFGMRMAMANSKADADQKYLYNGKEMQEETDWLDYGARMYDPAIGRWHVMDPLLGLYEAFSPYSYGLNDPISNIDYKGKAIIPGGGKHGGDLYTGIDAQNLFRGLQNRHFNRVKFNDDGLRYMRTYTGYAKYMQREKPKKAVKWIINQYEFERISKNYKLTIKRDANGMTTGGFPPRKQEISVATNAIPTDMKSMLVLFVSILDLAHEFIHVDQRLGFMDDPNEREVLAHYFSYFPNESNTINNIMSKNGKDPYNIGFIGSIDPTLPGRYSTFISKFNKLGESKQTKYKWILDKVNALVDQMEEEE